jgi:fructosamine-3-kinase
MKDLQKLFNNKKIIKVNHVGGGCINSCFSVTFNDNTSCFVKKNSASISGMFQAEASGLKALKSSNGPKVPEVIDVIISGSSQYLILEHIQCGSKKCRTMFEFGHKLAHLHLENIASECGFETDNFIGSTHQHNSRSDNWCDFFAQQRLLFQGNLAASRGLITSFELKKIESLGRKLHDFVGEPEQFSVLHGDLWGGNYMINSHGEAVLIDPAVYYGHFEADLAMTHLFGGFSRDFYEGYNDVNRVAPGFEQRCEIYNLYHMLNHLNLFGRSYHGSVAATLNRYT